MTNPCNTASWEESLSNEIKQSVNTLFGTMFDVSPKVLSSRVHQECAVRADVSGYIQLKKQHRFGTLVLSFPAKTVTALLESYFSQPFGELNPSALASIGELTNVLYGLIKKRMSENGCRLPPELPQVAVGKEHESDLNFREVTVVVDFSTSYGDFSVYVNFRRNVEEEPAGKKTA